MAPHQFQKGGCHQSPGWAQGRRAPYQVWWARLGWWGWGSDYTNSTGPHPRWASQLLLLWRNRTQSEMSNNENTLLCTMYVNCQSIESRKNSFEKRKVWNFVNMVRIQNITSILVWNMNSGLSYLIASVRTVTNKLLIAVFT